MKTPESGRAAQRRGSSTVRLHVRTALILAATAAGVALAHWTPGIRAVDGDTVEHGFWRWRLADVDAPEIVRARCPAEREAGLRAKARLEALLAATEGRWQLDRVGRRLDPYGRRIGRLWLISGHGAASGAVEAGAVLIAEGLADPYRAQRAWCR